MNLMKHIKLEEEKGGKKNMKKTLILMTVLNVLMMIAGVNVALAQQKTLIATPEPTSILLVLAGLLGIAGISRRKKK